MSGEPRYCNMSGEPRQRDNALSGVGTSNANSEAGNPAIVREQSAQYGTMFVLQGSLQLVGMLRLQSAPLSAPQHIYVTHEETGRDTEAEAETRAVYIARSRYSTHRSTTPILCR